MRRVARPLAGRPAATWAVAQQSRRLRERPRVAVRMQRRASCPHAHRRHPCPAPDPRLRRSGARAPAPRGFPRTPRGERAGSAARVREGRAGVLLTIGLGFAAGLAIGWSSLDRCPSPAVRAQCDTPPRSPSPTGAWCSASRWLRSALQRLGSRRVARLHGASSTLARHRRASLPSAQRRPAVARWFLAPGADVNGDSDGSSATDAAYINPHG